MPASESDLKPFFLLQSRQEATQFLQVVCPPEHLGTTWSMVMSVHDSCLVQYWHFQPSRLKRTRFLNLGGAHDGLMRLRRRMVAGTSTLFVGVL